MMLGSHSMSQLEGGLSSKCPGAGSFKKIGAQPLPLAVHLLRVVASLAVPVWPAFALRQAPLWWWWRRLESALAHALVWGFSRWRPQHAWVLFATITVAAAASQVCAMPRSLPFNWLQCLRFCSGGFLGHAKDLDAGGAFGGSRCGVRIQ
jgi:hypothetical protein